MQKEICTVVTLVSMVCRWLLWQLKSDFFYGYVTAVQRFLYRGPAKIQTEKGTGSFHLSSHFLHQFLSHFLSIFHHSASCSSIPLACSDCVTPHPLLSQHYHLSFSVHYLTSSSPFPYLSICSSSLSASLPAVHLCWVHFLISYSLFLYVHCFPVLGHSL